MENTSTDSLTDLDPEYHRLHAEHSNLKLKLQALAAKSHLSEDEELEERRLKKEKLLLKDRMEAIARSHRAGVTH